MMNKDLFLSKSDASIEMAYIDIALKLGMVTLFSTVCTQVAMLVFVFYYVKLTTI